MTGPIIIFNPGMAAGIPVQNIPNVSVQPTIPHGGTLTTEQAIEQGLKELEEQKATLAPPPEAETIIGSDLDLIQENTFLDNEILEGQAYPSSVINSQTSTTTTADYPSTSLYYDPNLDDNEKLSYTRNNITLLLPFKLGGNIPLTPVYPTLETTQSAVVRAHVPSASANNWKGSEVRYTAPGGAVPGGSTEIASYGYEADGRAVSVGASGAKNAEANEQVNSALRNTQPQVTKINTENAEKRGRNQEKTNNYNAEVAIANKRNKVLDAAHQAFLDQKNNINGNQTGNYLENRDGLLKALTSLNVADQRGYEELFRTFYIKEGLAPEAYNSFKEPPYGNFNKNYYETQDIEAKNKFDNIVALDDVDLLSRYGAVSKTDFASKENKEDYDATNFYRFNYTQRVLNGENVRANEAEDLKKYEGENLQAEDIITDESIQTIRDKQLGVTLDENSELDVIKNNDYWKKQYEAALSGDEKNSDYRYWQELQNDPAYSTESLTGGRIPVFEISKDKPNDFVSLFLKSQREADTTAIENIQSEAGSDAYITEFEDMINNLIGQERLQQVSQFGNLTKDALQQTVAEIQNQKAKEQNIAFYQGLGSFSEVFNAGKTIADSFLNDSGIGGILPMSNRGRDYAKRLEDKLEGSISGLKNSVEYNWETWFKDTLSKRYSPNYEENKERYQPYEIKENILTAFNKFLNRNLGVDPYNQEEGEFNAVFLDAAGFNDTAELINYLNDQAIKEEEILENPESLNALTEAERAALSTSSLDILNLIQETSPTRNEVSEYGEFIKKIENLITNQRNAIDSIDEELGNNLTIDGIDETVAGRFARDFVNDYLKPRFDTSRSMDEFVEYMDVRQEEKNPFQTEDLAFALRNAGQIQANAYLEELQKRSGETSKFNTDFYFDPMGNGARVNPQKEQELQNQSETVNKDWEDAQENNFKNEIPGTTMGDTWYAQAYRYGLGGFNEEGKWTLSKDDFAQLHYWIIGQYNDYDPALDLLNSTIVTDKAQSIIDTYLKDKAAAIDSPFGRFITPEEFADELLEGVNPYDEKYDQILEDLGLEDFKGTLDDLKGYIIDIMRTGSALEIRENIKYLNEQREDPNQEILGITYIDRPEDFTNETPKGKTWLFESFQKSGYQGTEDEFYESFLPDVDRSEMELLGEVQSGKGLEFGFGLQDALSDPLAAYSNIGSFLNFGKDETDGTDENQTTTKQTTQKETNVFNVFDLGYDDEDTYTKSKSAQEFLGEFAPYFK